MVVERSRRICYERFSRLVWKAHSLITSIEAEKGDITEAEARWSVGSNPSLHRTMASTTAGSGIVEEALATWSSWCAIIACLVV